MAKKYALTLQAQLKNTKSIEQEILAVKKKWEREGLTNVKIAVKTDNGAIKSMTASVKDMAGGSRRAVVAIDKVNGELKNTETVTTGVAKSTKKAAKATNYFSKGMLGAAKTAAQYALGLGLIYKAMAEIGKGVQYIKDLDKEMRDIQIVAGYTDEQIRELATDYNELAKAMGATTLEVASGSLEWTRQGKTIAETQELLRSTLMLSKLGNVEAAESTEYLTSTLNGFKMEAKDAEGVVDKLVAVDNAAATSVKELATALQKSSVSAQAAGVDFDTLVAYIGTVSSITRLSAETVGTSFKTMFARFQDIKEGAIDGEGAINNVERALGRLTLASGEQMSILDRQTGEFKEFSTVVEELAGQWHTLSEMEQANIVKAFAGVRQRESFLALMENQAMMHSLLAEEMNSEGLAAERYGTYLEGLEAAQNKATAAWEGMIAATVDGGLVKWFYDAQAGLFGFVENLGGLDAILPLIVAGLISYATYAITASGATITLAGSMTALAGVLETIQILVMLNPLGALIALTGVLITEMIAFKKTSDEMTEDLASNWSDSMDKVANSTQGTGAMLRKFAKDVEFLEGLSAWEKLWVDESKLLEEGLKNTFRLIEKNTSGWREYKEATEIAALAAGYMIDNQGRLYTEYYDGYEVVKLYAEGLDTLSYSQMTAGAEADQLAEQIERVSNAAKSAEEPIAELSENFQAFIESTKELGGDDVGIGKVADDFTEINRLFQEGLYTADEYFEQMEEGIASMDMTETFAGNDEAALTFFSGLSVNAVEAISTINAEWENGEVSFTTYMENLSGASEMLSNLGEMAQGFFGENEEAAEGMNLLSAATDELNGRLEVNATVRDTLRQVVEQELQFNTEAFNLAMRNQAEIMAQSDIVYRTTTGNALKSADEIYGYLVETDGNMQKLASQTANQTQNTMKNAATGTAMLLNGLADMIDGFSATISFTPVVTGGITLDALGLHLPSVEMKVSGTGVGDFIRSAASQIDDWNPEPVDASVYTQGAGGTDYGGASSDADEYADTVGSVSNALRELAKDSGKTTDQLEEDAKSIDALVAMVVKKIKQEQKARKEALKDQLDGYKKIIDTRKDLLKSYEDEVKFQRELEDKQRELSSVQSEMAELRLDDSEEAQARMRALAEEEAEIQKSIDEDAFDRSIELQENALDAEYNNFKEYIDAQIGDIDDYLSKDGQVVGDALSLIQEKGESLYSDLSNWNSEYGSGIQQDVVSAWDDAYEAISRYAGGLSSITGNSIGSTPSYTDVGVDSGYGSSKAVAGLVAGGVSSPSGIGMNAPKTEGGTSGGVSMEKFLELNVAGNLDSSTLPQIEAIVDRAIEKLNESMRSRGYGQRGAGQYSI